VKLFVGTKKEATLLWFLFLKEQLKGIIIIDTQVRRVDLSQRQQKKTMCLMRRRACARHARLR
jgi:hypothetical protein